MKLLRSLVMNDADAPYVSAWEWSVGWTWVMHALEVYAVEWRALERYCRVSGCMRWEKEQAVQGRRAGGGAYT
jgi:hypothetical protein